MSALLTIDGVSMRFGAYRALDRIDLEVRQGEFVALLGPSGCGKTTLLRSIAGFLKPESGRILIEGRDISHLAAHHRPLNTVFQNYALFPHMSVLENVAYGPRRQGASRSGAS
ncbi:ABC transporter ATP-binding protein, partial [Achromobacter denitrificans]